MNIYIEGQTLKSLRKRYKATIEVAGRMTDRDPEQLEEWEENGVELSLTDAKKLAKAFHSHWSVFLLKTKVKPIEEPINHRAGYSDNSAFSSETLRAYEVARKLLDSSEEIDGRVIEPALLSIHTQAAATSPQAAAKTVRQVMGINSVDITKIAGGVRGVDRFWRTQVAGLGIYISEQKMPKDETKAFLLRDENRAVIVINKNDRYPYSRIFSLLHELGHLVKGEESAACIVNEYASRSSADETWCNRFASELAAYDEDVLADSRVDTIKDSPDPAKTIKLLSHKFKVSFTVMLYKLKKHNKVTDTQCREMKSFFDNVIRDRYYPAVDADHEFRLGKAFYINRDISKASVGLTTEVMEKQAEGSISYSQAAELLDTKVKYLEDIKQRVGFGN